MFYEEREKPSSLPKQEDKMNMWKRSPKILHLHMQKAPATIRRPLPLLPT